MNATALFPLLLVSALAAAALRADQTNHVSFDVEPYLWVADLEVETSLPGLPSSASGANRYDSRITAGAMLAVQARYRSVGVLADFDWLQLTTEKRDPGRAYSAVELKSDFFRTTAALTYRLPLRGRFHADLAGGARIWHVNETLEFQSGALQGFTRSGNKTWTDPVLGMDLRYDLSRRWSLVTQGMVGGFGVASDLAWEVFGGVNYHITDWWSATVGYRYLREDYDRQGFQLHLDAQGFLVGLGFHF